MMRPTGIGPYMMPPSMLYLHFPPELSGSWLLIARAPFLKGRPVAPGPSSRAPTTPSRPQGPIHLRQGRLRGKGVQDLTERKGVRAVVTALTPFRSPLPQKRRHPT